MKIDKQENGRSFLYRFELAFDGEPQDIGLLQGVDDIPMLALVRDAFYGMFGSLNSPDVFSEDDSKVVFWFTEEGLKKYSNAINFIIPELEKNNWQVIAMPLRFDSGVSNFLTMDDALYEDAFQVAFSYTDVYDTHLHDYREIKAVDVTCENPLVFKEFLPDKIQAVDIQNAIERFAGDGHWLEGDDLEELGKQRPDLEYVIDYYLHGHCDDWVLEHFQDGDLAVVWNEFSEEIEKVCLVHCYIQRGDVFLDVRGETDDEGLIEEGFEYNYYDNDRVYCESLVEFKEVIRDIIAQPSLDTLILNTENMKVVRENNAKCINQDIER